MSVTLPTGKERGFEKGREVVKDKLNSDQADLEFYRYAIADWTGVVDTDKNPIPCTDEMKDLLCDEIGDLATFVFDKATSIGATIEEGTEASLKNSNSSPDGSTPAPAE